MRAILTVVFLLSVFLSGCTSVRYYSQSIRGQWQLMSQSRPIDKWLAQAQTPEKLKVRLRLVQSIRNYASSQLALPDNGSYSSYVDLERPYVVWNVLAAPHLSLEPYQWRYPIIGQQIYRGFFNQVGAETLAKTMESQGYDVAVNGVSAYSTLGWFDDPVLSSFINYSDAQLAGLIFHELSHQVVYIKDDTVFNESFASMVELEGVTRWLKATGNHDLAGHQQRYKDFNQSVIALILATKKNLEALYSSHAGIQEKRKQKGLLFAKLKADYWMLRQNFDSKSAWDTWFKQDLNNADLITIDAYYDKVDEFQALFSLSKQDFKSFFARVRALAELSKTHRDEKLRMAKEANLKAIIVQ